MASFAASDAAMISASQVLNATGPPFFWKPTTLRLGQVGTRNQIESVSQPSPHRRSPQVGVRMGCSANRHVCGVRDMLVPSGQPPRVHLSVWTLPYTAWRLRTQCPAYS